jgi:hypothetical protein
MNTENTSGLVPVNEVGKAVNIEETVIESNAEDAKITFNRACKRLQNPEIWNDLADTTLGASFHLVDQHQEIQQRLAKTGDYLMIEIPGPKNAEGDGFDWVQLTRMEQQADPQWDESFGIQLMACANPQHPQGGSAHFFKEGATSTFLLGRKEKKVTAAYFGRNEKPNTEAGSNNIVRNIVVAIGAMLGLSEIQWSALVKGLLAKEIGGEA